MRLKSLSLTPEQFTALVDELRFRYHKWDAYVSGKLRVLPTALTLTSEEHAAAVALCEKVHDILARATNRLMEEPHWLDLLGIPAAVREIIRAEETHPHSIVRYDLIQTTAGWMIPEVNEDAPGGFNECVASHALFSNLLDGATIPGNLVEYFLKSIPDGKRAGLVYATGYAEDLQHVLILASLLRSQGIEPVLASPEHLTCRPYGQPHLQGEPVDWIFRFFPGEWYGHLDNIAAWKRTASRIPIVNPLSRLLRQSKGLFALWHEEPLLDSPDMEVLNQHTPYTEFFRISRHDEYLANRENWVLKKKYGRMGDTVCIGRMCKQEEWEKEIATAARTPEEYIAQCAFTPLPVANGTNSLFPALGAYLINGKFADYYSRADEIGLTTHEAYYVVTTVETS